MILAADIGATKVLLEAGDVDEGRWKPFLARRYAVADFPSMAAVMQVFMKEWDGARPSRARLVAGAMGVAGPAEGNCVRMTHRPWVVDGDALGDQFGIGRLRVVNDLAATASGIAMLSSRDFFTLQAGRVVEGASQVVLGVGTGLGVAYRVPKIGDAPSKIRDAPSLSLGEGASRIFRSIPGEGGHVGFSPASAEQANLWRVLFETHGRVEVEGVVSGRGIANIHHALTGATLEPAEICDRAFGKGEAAAVRTLDVFAECLGNVAGDHALAVMARGGVYIAGGVMSKIARSLNREKFAAAFCAKGAMSSLLARIPVRAVTNERLGILGAARIATAPAT